MKKGIFYRCMGCFYKYSNCNPAKRRIPRQKKKQLVKLIERPIYKHMFHKAWFDLSSCDMTGVYKELKPLLNITTRLDSMIVKFFQSLKGTDWERDGIYINENGRLSWYWEYDSDYGGSSGVMPFCYDEKSAGKTWAYSEMHQLFYYLTKGRLEKMPVEIKSDKDLLNYFKNNPTPEHWIDD